MVICGTNWYGFNTPMRHANPYIFFEGVREVDVSYRCEEYQALKMGLERWVTFVVTDQINTVPLPR